MVEHITEKRWREVFLLTAGMMRKADELMRLMKHKIDGLVASDKKLQQFLEWVNQKYAKTRFSNKSIDFIDLVNLSNSLYQASHITAIKTYISEIEYSNIYEFLTNCFEATDHALIIIDELSNSEKNKLEYMLDIISYLHACIQLVIKTEELQTKHFNLNISDQTVEIWWQTNSKSWSNKFKSENYECRNIGDEWQFTDAQKKLLHQYYDANRLLVDCLNSDCYVSREVRKEIEDTLLLPMAEIEKRQQGKVD